VSAETTFVRTSDALWRRVGSEVLLASPEGPEVASLSVPASAAWLLLDRPRTTRELVESLALEFSVDTEEIRGRVDDLVQQLETRGWLVRVNDRG
jgi:hypothetical protein